jgi:hypothetical protein
VAGPQDDNVGGIGVKKGDSPRSRRLSPVPCPLSGERVFVFVFVLESELEAALRGEDG